MINAIAMLLSTIGLVLVLLPEPILVMSSSNGESMLKLTKEVVEDTPSKMEETLVDTKDTLAKGVEVVAKPKEKSMGWFRRKPKLEDQLKLAKEKFDLGKEATNEAIIELKDETLEKLNLATQSIKEKTTGDKTIQANGATKDATNLDNGYKMESAIHKIEQIVEGVAKDACISATEILESTKEETFKKIGRTQDSIYDGVGHITEKLQDVVIGAKDKAYDVSVKTKDITSNIVEFPKDKVNEGVHLTHDVIVGSLQSGLKKIQSAIVDVSKKVKEVVEHSTQDTKEIGHGILKQAKDVACKSGEFLQTRTQEGGSYLPNLGQGFGHVYNKEQTLKEATTNIGENVEEIGEDAKSNARDVLNSGMDLARRSYDNMKNIGDHYFHDGKDQVGKSYEYVTDTAQDYYNKVGQQYEMAKDYYDGSTHHHNSRGDRRFYKGARDVPSQSFYDDAKDEDDGYFHNVKDKTKHAFDGAYHRTKKSYDDARDKINGFIPNRHEERSREHISMARQRIANGYHNVHDQAKDYYKKTKLKPREDLGAMVESMGWRRVGIVAPNHVPISSDDEVIIGNVKYEWDNKGEHSSDEIASSSVLNSMKGSKHDMDERIDLAQEYITKSAQNVRDIGIRVKDQIHDVSQAIQEDRPSQLQEHLSSNHRSEYEEYEDDNNNNDNKDDDHISSRRIRNRVKGRMRNRSHLRTSPRFRRDEYANLVKKDPLDFAHYVEDQKNIDKGRVLRLWRNTFLKRPEGFFLLLTRALHLFTFSIIYGSSFWVTFVSGFILSKHIPRQQFGYVQSRIFPMYLRILIAGQSVLFILHSILHPWFIADSVECWELSNFGLMIVSTIINAYVLEPQATKVMFERLKVEKEEGRGLENVASPMDAKLLKEELNKKLASINQQFKTLHNYSSALNLISLGGLTSHLWHLAHRLVI